MKYFCLTVLMVVANNCNARSNMDSTRITTKPYHFASDEDSTIQKRKNWVWLMAAASFDIVDPNLGGDLDIWGYSSILGVAWHNMTFLFTTPSARDYAPMTTIDEHRYDYGFFWGYSNRGRNYLINVSAGLSRVDYHLKGNLITQESTYNSFDAVYQWSSGIAYGPAAMINIFGTLPIFEGAGIGSGGSFYVSLAKGVSYFALEFDLIELNIPIPVQ